MKRTIAGVFCMAIVTVMSFTGLLLTHQPAQAQALDLCYAVADNGGAFGPEDVLVTLNRVTGETTIVGYTGSHEIEAIAFAPGGGVLYAADEEELGTLDLGTGKFTEFPVEFGSGNGEEGLLPFDDVDGLTYDVGRDVLYGSVRRDDGEPDLLIQINRATGTFIPGVFDGGHDYVLIDGPGAMSDIDDIAVHPGTGVMYGASNEGGDGGVLITIDKDSGAATVVGEFNIDDIEGLAFFNDGRLYGSTGKKGRYPATRNQLYLIDENSGAASLVGSFSDFQDYEALDCLTGPTAVTLSRAGVTPTGNLALWLIPALIALTLLTITALHRRHATQH